MRKEMQSKSWKPALIIIKKKRQGGFEAAKASRMDSISCNDILCIKTEESVGKPGINRERKQQTAESFTRQFKCQPLKRKHRLWRSEYGSGKKNLVRVAAFAKQSILSSWIIHNNVASYSSSLLYVTRRTLYSDTKMLLDLYFKICASDQWAYL